MASCGILVLVDTELYSSWVNDCIIICNTCFIPHRRVFWMGEYTSSVQDDRTGTAGLKWSRTSWSPVLYLVGVLSPVPLSSLSWDQTSPPVPPSSGNSCITECPLWVLVLRNDWTGMCLYVCLGLNKPLCSINKTKYQLLLNIKVCLGCGWFGSYYFFALKYFSVHLFCFHRVSQFIRFSDVDCWGVLLVRIPSV